MCQASERTGRHLLDSQSDRKVSFWSPSRYAVLKIECVSLWRTLPCISPKYESSAIKCSIVDFSCFFRRSPGVYSLLFRVEMQSKLTKYVYHCFEMFHLNKVAKNKHPIDLNCSRWSSCLVLSHKLYWCFCRGNTIFHDFFSFGHSPSHSETFH